MKKLVSIALLFLASCTTSTNSWEITTNYYSLPIEEYNQRTESTFLTDGYMKMENGYLTTIFNLKDNLLTYINMTNETYWQGTPTEFITEAREELAQIVETRLEMVAEHERELVRGMYMEMIDATFPLTPITNPEKREYTLKQIHEQDTISGYHTIKYEVFENALPLETVWIAKELQLTKDFNFQQLSQFLNQLAGGAYASSFESSSTYFKLLEKGYPVKVQIRRGDGSLNISEVTGVEKVSLSSQDFTAPQHFQKSSLSAIGIWEGFM